MSLRRKSARASSSLAERVAIYADLEIEVGANLNAAVALEGCNEPSEQTP